MNLLKVLKKRGGIIFEDFCRKDVALEVVR